MGYLEAEKGKMSNYITDHGFISFLMQESLSGEARIFQMRNISDKEPGTLSVTKE